MSIPVCWWNKERGSWACTHFLNTVFDSYHCVHSTWLDHLPTDGAIIVFHGSNLSLCGNGPKNAEWLNDAASKMKWVIFVSIGDEAQDFDTTLLHHGNMKLWVQAPLPTTKADRYLIQGFPANTQRDQLYNRDRDFVFMGQVTHARRIACVAAMKKIDRPNILVETSGFGKGLQQRDYLSVMSSAKIAPCPAGPMTPDTFRVYEALECGAIPILDAVSMRPETRGVWPLLLGDHPLPIIEDWATLPDVMAPLLADWDRQSQLVGMWWRARKAQMRNWLAQDLLALGVTNGREEETSAATTSAT